MAHRLSNSKRLLSTTLMPLAYALNPATSVGKINDQRKAGFWPIRKTTEVLSLPDTLDVLHWHGDTFDLPADAHLFAESAGCRNQMFLAANGLALGLQCHIETTAEMVDDFCREDASYLIPPTGQGRWMQDAARMRSETAASETWIDLCALADLPPNAGPAARAGDTQFALFHLPDSDEKVFALANFDPKGHANVLARGILGDIKGERVVASPLYKQHYRLRDGHCLEDESLSVPAWTVRIEAGRVLVAT